MPSDQSVSWYPGKPVRTVFEPTQWCTRNDPPADYCARHLSDDNGATLRAIMADERVAGARVRGMPAPEKMVNRDDESSCAAFSLHPKREGARLEFWTHGMVVQHGVRGVVGTFKAGQFWSHDMADHWSPSEIQFWAYF